MVMTVWPRCCRFTPIATSQWARTAFPDAAPRAVEGTGFDFRQPKRLDADFLRDLDQQKVKGYDHSFLLGETPSDTSTGAALQLAAELRSADGRVSLQVRTDQPALHLYTGQYLGGTEKRDGSHYADLAGVALESQFPPDSPSHAGPSCCLGRPTGAPPVSTSASELRGSGSDRRGVLHRLDQQLHPSLRGHQRHFIPPRAP